MTAQGQIVKFHQLDNLAVFRLQQISTKRILENSNRPEFAERQISKMFEFEPPLKEREGRFELFQKLKKSWSIRLTNKSRFDRKIT